MFIPVGIMADMTTQRYEAPTRDKVVKMVKKGVGTKAIAWELGISRARVYQHIERARQLGELPTPAA